jgi:hypothetical protein
MGYRTPNIDRIANEGMRFTDSYGEQKLPTQQVLDHYGCPTSPALRRGGQPAPRIWDG